MCRAYPVKSLEPLSMARDAEPRIDGCCGGAQGQGAGMRPAQADDRGRSGRAPPSPGYRGRPPRSCLVRAKRGNPVEVRPRLPDERSADRKESSTPRREQDDQERTPAAERQRETATVLISALLLMVAHNRPDTDPLCSGAKAR
jgi:hypothetical protein